MGYFSFHLALVTVLTPPVRAHHILEVLQIEALPERSKLRSEVKKNHLDLIGCGLIRSRRKSACRMKSATPTMVYPPTQISAIVHCICIRNINRADGSVYESHDIGRCSGGWDCSSIVLFPRQ